MADKKISQLTGATTPLTGTEELAIVQGGSTVKATAQDIADLGGGGTLPVLNTYPVTTPASAGTRFWYKGNEWHYMTQDEIDSTGWNGLVSVGFPAPVNKYADLSLFIESQTAFSSFNFAQINLGNSIIENIGLLSSVISEVNFLGLGAAVSKIKTINLRAAGETQSYRNAGLLTSLQDVGTSPSLNLSSPGSNNITASVLNNLFTQLPSTTNTATIDVRNTTGAATCNPTIATAKGYTVITS